MAIRVAINGFGRIGRLTFRNLMARAGEFDVVGVNDLTDNKTLATLLKYDSLHGRFPGTVDFDDKNLIVNGDKIPVYEERDPSKLPWGDLKVDVVVESTGVFPCPRYRQQAWLRFTLDRRCQESCHQCACKRRS